MVHVYWYIGAGRGHGTKRVVSTTSLFASSLVLVLGINTFSLNVFIQIHAPPQIDAPPKNFWIMYLKSVSQSYL